MEIKRIYHHYEKWEDWKHGFYDNVSGKNKQELISKVIELFSSYEKTELYMSKVINEWKYSCEQNLTNMSMNRIAYLGQAACCLYAGVPCYITMNAWNYLDFNIQNRSNLIAKKYIYKWEQKKKYENILNNGKKNAIQMEFQMKLQLN